jgi:hypothetical protein
MLMSAVHAPARSTVAGTSSPFPTRPSRRLLLFAQFGWSVAILIDAALFVSGVHALFAVVHQPCSASGAACMPAQLSLADFRALGGPGPTLNAYVVYALVTVVTASLVWAAVGVLIAWRKWGDPMALFVSLVLITYAPVTITFGATPTIAFGTAHPMYVPEVLALSGPVISILGIAVTELFYPTLAVFLLTFPTGRFAPRWSALIVLLWIVQDVLFFVRAPFVIIQLCLFASSGSVAVIQVYRYARCYTPVQRQQTKWVVGLFAIVALPLYIGYTVAPVFWPSLNASGSAYRLADIAALMLTGTPISLGVGVAILRYRLYDIDVIIRRTLIYGTLTALLAIMYFASVVSLQALAQALTGARSLPPIAVVASTLLIAALFDPLRRRVQFLIDRRFYRGKYDAERTLAAFGEALSTETNLEQLSARVMAVVEETMHPAHAWLWLRPSSAHRDAKEEHSISRSIPPSNGTNSDASV